MNVLDNACDAVARGGNVWLRTEVIHDRDGGQTPGREAASVVVTITDDGPGIPAEHLIRLCDPFFTTKPPGAGMGLGLALARRIVEDHNGEIVISNGSTGALVSIRLPVH
ncbi:MAG: hypothetical protein HY271_15620 [Deltaproteobacteria bacterium]|nr:hypothetical protein [Deltaproteobacteria bacterium]